MLDKMIFFSETLIKSQRLLEAQNVIQTGRNEAGK
jgi:hypothetical protein